MNVYVSDDRTIDQPYQAIARTKFAEVDPEFDLQ